MKSRHTFEWTDERVAMLTERWNAGISAGRIATEFGQGLNKNQVLGKVHRLGLPRRATLDSLNPPARKPVPAKATPIAHSTPFARPGVSLPPKPTRQDVFADRPGSIAHEDLRARHCQWPLGERPFRFCGCRRVSGRPYCSEHEAIASGPGSQMERSAHRVGQAA
jgi:GcrA cell cycle regulator